MIAYYIIRGPNYDWVRRNLDPLARRAARGIVVAVQGLAIAALAYRRERRRGLAAALAVLLTLPGERALATGAAEPDLGAFEAEFGAGQALLDRGDALAAARTWTRAAALLPEVEAYREHRAAIFAYIAQAYQEALDDDPALAVEALAALDGYAVGHAAAYPSRTVGAAVTGARAAIRAASSPRRADATATVAVPERPRRLPPWKRLALGSGLAMGGGAAFAVLFAVELARARSLQRALASPLNMCAPERLGPDCGQIVAAGRTANRLQITGAVAAPLLLGVGIVLAVVAARRRPSRRSLAPVAGFGHVGVLWESRF